MYKPKCRKHNTYIENAPKNAGKRISEVLNFKNFREACPRTPQSKLRLEVPVWCHNSELCRLDFQALHSRVVGFFVVLEFSVRLHI